MTLDRFVLGVILAVAPASGLAAHPLASCLLSLEIDGAGSAAVEWRVPLAVASQSELEVRLPPSCTAASAPEVKVEDQILLSRWRARCGALTAGESLSVSGLATSASDVLTRVRLADGRWLRGVLSGHQPSLELPAPTQRVSVVKSYFSLGLDHILGGLDHLAFVLGLLILTVLGQGERRLRRLVATVTAFTLGHSVTLSLVVLGVTWVPPAPVEIAIALSILLLAAEIASRGGGKVGWIARCPWGAASAFGLLHGLGFAGALAEIGLPTGEIPAALLAFNLGIETGQLAVVLAAAVPLVLVVLPRPALSVPVHRYSGYTIGSLAAFWFWERVVAII